MRLGLKVIIDQVLSHTSDQHPWFRESRASRDNPKADWYVWADPQARRHAAQQLALDLRRLGLGMGYAAPASTTCTISWPRSPTSTSTTAAVQDALLDICRFWLERGVDGFRLDTVNFYFHSQGLESNPPTAKPTIRPRRRRSTPTTSRSTSTTRASPRISPSWSASARSSTSIRRRRRSARSATGRAR